MFCVPLKKCEKEQLPVEFGQSAVSPFIEQVNKVVNVTMSPSCNPEIVAAYKQLELVGSPIPKYGPPLIE